MKTLQPLFKGAKLIETIENYSLIEDKKIQSNNFRQSSLESHFYKDEEFWKSILADPKKYWGQKIDLYDFVVSDWIARIPGLYWTKSSRALRRHTNEDIAIQSQEWIEFHPPGKSKKVLGGIGTILLPPSEDGKVLMSVTSSCNASLGIPILVFPDVLDQLNLQQGDSVRIRGAKWQSMDNKWTENFATTKDIPNGYLVIDHIDKIDIYRGDYPIVYHPFSLMEYEYKDTLLYDFVYVTADNKANYVDRKIEDFFRNYAQKEGRNGEYLLNPNIVTPIFESRYLCPADLRHPTEKAKLDLLYERIRKTHFKGTGIDELIIQLPQFYQSATSIKTLARNVGFNVSLLVDDSAVSMASLLINGCIKKELIENLIDRMNYDYPQIFKGL